MQDDPAPDPRHTRRRLVAAAGLVLVLPLLGPVDPPLGSASDGRDTLVLADAQRPGHLLAHGGSAPEWEPAPVVAPPTTTAVTALAVAPETAAPGTEAAEVAAPEAAVPGGIPAVALAAYQAAEARLRRDRPRCRLDWALLAAIGRVESDHGRYAGRALGPDGRSRPTIRGVRLDGSHGTAVIPDSEDGREDGDVAFDRAVGPMQFLPATWRAVAVDADGDGQRSADDLDDAALGAGVYLCASGEVHSFAGRSAAVFRYNRSQQYVRTVLALANRYAGSPVEVLPDAPGGERPPAVLPLPAPQAPLPAAPADLGPASSTVLPPAASVPGPAGPVLTATVGQAAEQAAPGDAAPAAPPASTPPPGPSPSPSGESPSPAASPPPTSGVPAESPSPPPGPPAADPPSPSSADVPACPESTPSPAAPPSASPSASPSPSPATGKPSEPAASPSPAPTC